jgi:hypothetical protein
MNRMTRHVDRLLGGAQGNALGLERAHDVLQVADAAGQAIDASERAGFMQFLWIPSEK